MPGEEDQAAFRQGLGTIWDAVMAAPVHGASSRHIEEMRASNRPHSPCLRDEHERAGLTTKLVGKMVAARLGLFLFAGTNREYRTKAPELAAQNHDSVLLANGTKVPIRIRDAAKNMSTRTARGGAASYDERVRYVNMRATINQALQTMNGQYRREHFAFRSRYGGATPSTIEVGRALRQEIAGRRCERSVEVFLDFLAEQFRATLGVEHLAPQALGRKSHAPRRQSTAPWEALPPTLLARHEQASPDAEPVLMQAIRAREQYLRHANSPPSRDALQSYAVALRASTDPFYLKYGVSAYLDLALLADTSPAEAAQLLDAAHALTNRFEAKGLREAPLESLDSIIRLQLDRAYLPKYRKKLQGEPLTLDDETNLYLQLLSIAQAVPHAGHNANLQHISLHQLRQIRGAQFELGVHLLNARLNVRNGRLVQHMWPSLRREDEPHAVKYKENFAWDAAVSSGEFLSYDPATCVYLQCKSGNEASDTENHAARETPGVKYDERITILRSLEDLGQPTSADILRSAIDELCAQNPAAIHAAKQNLDTCERLFLEKLASAL